MSFWVAGTMAAGAVLNYVGSQNASNAAQKAANSQADAARIWRNSVDDKIAGANANLDASVTPAMMASHARALAAQEATVQRQESLAQSISPALLNAGKQLNQLLEGQSAPVLDNIKNQRQLQRQQLTDQLNQQMGPGGSSSAAGQQQLQKFDSDTANMLSQTQQQYISQLSGMSVNGMGQLVAASGSANTTAVNINAADPMAQNNIRKANLAIEALGPQGQAQQGIMQTAGANQVGASLQGQSQAALGSNIMQMGAAYAGRKAAATPTTPDNPGTSGNNSFSNNFNNSLQNNGGGTSMGATNRDMGTMPA